MELRVIDLGRNEQISFCGGPVNKEKKAKDQVKARAVKLTKLLKCTLRALCESWNTTIMLDRKKSSVI